MKPGGSKGGLRTIAALYVPVEVQHLIRHPSWFTAGVLVTNVIIVFYLAGCLRSGRKLAQSSPAN